MEENNLEIVEDVGDEMLDEELEVETEVETEMDDAGYLVEKGKIPPKLRSPNGRNGDPERQAKAWEYYVASWREGKPNIYQAGIKAGFTKATAMNINHFKWFKDKKDKLRRSRMLTKAERNLDRALDLDYSKIKLLPNGEQVDTVDVDLLKVVVDVSKTIVTTLGKDDGYSTRTDIGGKMESEVKINSISYADPVLIENTAVDEAVKQIENAEEKIIEEVIKQNVGDNPTS